MLPLAEQKRISLIVLGNHVQEVAERDLWDWAERETVAAWGTVPIELLAPVSLADVTDFPRWHHSGKRRVVSLPFSWSDLARSNKLSRLSHYPHQAFSLKQSLPR